MLPFPRWKSRILCNSIYLPSPNTSKRTYPNVQRHYCYSKLEKYEAHVLTKVRQAALEDGDCVRRNEELEYMETTGKKLPKQWSISDNLLYYKGRLYVHANEARSAPSIFLPLRFTNTKLLGARSPPTPTFPPRLGLASLSPGHVPGWPPSPPLVRAVSCSAFRLLLHRWRL